MKQRVLLCLKPKLALGGSVSPSPKRQRGRGLLAGVASPSPLRQALRTVAMQGFAPFKSLDAFIRGGAVSTGITGVLLPYQSKIWFLDTPAKIVRWRF